MFLPLLMQELTAKKLEYIMTEKWINRIENPVDRLYRLQEERVTLFYLRLRLLALLQVYLIIVARQNNTCTVRQTVSIVFAF
jgi:hypothetical protein